MNMKHIGSISRLMPLAVLVWSVIGSAGCDEGFINEPGIIDIHAHIGRFRGYDLSLSNLLLNLEENRISCALISNIDGAAIEGVTADLDEITINEETARVTATYPILKPLVWARPGARDSGAANVEPFLRDRGFVGIKFHPEFNRFQASSEAVIPYIQLCEKYRVPAIFHCGRSPGSSAQAIYVLARQFPAVPFILYHMGFGANHDEAIEVAREAREKGDALIYLETSQADEQAVIKAIRAAGADRMLFGSDATYYGRYHYRSYATMLRAVKQSIPASDFEKFIRGNALRLFRLDPERR
ncbi:MAG TPA: amidohydrolase family protein [Blastocatellia bacterium]|nr:amidohydrolase family protein [Blastocatellia bacterium]